MAHQHFDVSSQPTSASAKSHAILCCCYLKTTQIQGVPIEEIEYKFRNHWAWGKLMAKHDAAQEAKVVDDIADDLAAARGTSSCKVDVAKKGKREM